MSIVEQALKKLQHARLAGVRHEERTTTRMGVIVEEPAHSASTSGGDDVPAPKRTVQLNRDALLKAGFLPPESQQRRIADQFRHIKRPLVGRALGRGGDAIPNGRRIMVAGSMPGEGKTFTSINLAMSISQERDATVLLVDADVAKPNISRMFGLGEEPGLLEALMDPALDPEALVLPTDMPGLSLLPAGRPRDNATELLASNRMRQVVERLDSARGDSRIAVFDSPPLLLTNESRVLAHSMGQIVLVVRAGSTPQQAVLDAIDCLGDTSLVGLVLNQSDSLDSTGYYYGDMAYGSYGSYGNRAE